MIWTDIDPISNEAVPKSSNHILPTADTSILQDQKGTAIRHPD